MPGPLIRNVEARIAALPVAGIVAGLAVALFIAVLSGSVTVWVVCLALCGAGAWVLARRHRVLKAKRVVTGSGGGARKAAKVQRRLEADSMFGRLTPGGTDAVSEGEARNRKVRDRMDADSAFRDL
jgi:hypothetical protein